MPSRRPFSKLKKEIESLFVEGLDMEFCCRAYPIRGQWNTHNSIPRFYVRLSKKVIWDFPRNFEIKDIEYGYWAGNNHISELVRDYIDTGTDQLLAKEFKQEHQLFIIHDHQTNQEKSVSIYYKLTPLFIAADRRLGRQKLKNWSKNLHYATVDEILKRRYSKENPD